MTTIAESINRGLKKLEEFDKPGKGLISQGVRRIAEGVGTAWKAVNEDLAKKRKLFTSGEGMSDEGLQAASEAAIDWAGSLGFSGQLKGVAPEIAKRIRAVMKAQNRLRQRRKATPFSDVQVPEDEIVNAVANSVTFRNFGRDQAGSVGERLAPGKGTRHGSAFNVGEPHGVSTTFDPKFAADWKGGSVPINRVLNLYTARPSDVILQGWKGSKHEPVMQEAYAYALARQDPKKLREVLKSHVDEGMIPSGTFDAVMKQIHTGKSYDEALKAAIPPVAKGSKIKINVPALESVFGAGKDDFGRLMNQYFESKGFEGILYSPNRFKGFGHDMLGEAEIKMFNPKRVVPLEKPRVGDDPVVDRFRHANLGKDPKPAPGLGRMIGQSEGFDLTKVNAQTKKELKTKITEKADRLKDKVLTLGNSSPGARKILHNRITDMTKTFREEILPHMANPEDFRYFEKAADSLDTISETYAAMPKINSALRSLQVDSAGKNALVVEAKRVFGDNIPIAQSIIANPDQMTRDHFRMLSRVLEIEPRSKFYDPSHSLMERISFFETQFRSAIDDLTKGSTGLRNPGIARYAEDLAHTPGSLGKIYEGIDSDKLRKALREGARERGHVSKAYKAERAESAKYAKWAAENAGMPHHNLDTYIKPENLPTWNNFSDQSSVKMLNKALAILYDIPKSAHGQFFKILNQLDNKTPKQIVDELTNWVDTSFI